MHKLRITPAEGRPYIKRGFAALDHVVARRKAGELVRAGKDGDTAIKAVDIISVPAAR